MAVSFSRDLEQTLHNALKEASDRTHVYATLEHLLCALIDDTHASRVMDGCGVNRAELQQQVRHYLDTELDALRADVTFSNESDDEEEAAGDEEIPANDEEESDDQSSEEKADAKAVKLTRAKYNKDGPTPTSGFQRTVQRSILHVQSSGRDEVTGANVLVALFSERESYAVYFLQQQDLSRLDAVTYISHGVSKQRDPADPLPRAAETSFPRLLPRVLRDDLRPHSDGVPSEPVLVTREAANRIADFLTETAAGEMLKRSGGRDSPALVTVGVFGPWGSGKSTLLSEIGKSLSTDGATVVFINTWKWDGKTDVFSFVNKQLIESLNRTARWAPTTLLLKAILFCRAHPRKILFLIGLAVAAAVAAYLIDWQVISASSAELLSYRTALAAAWGTVAGLAAKPLGSLLERLLLPKAKDVQPGEELSKSYAYLMLTSRLGLRKKRVVFLFDDLDRCDEARVVEFMQSIHRLTSQGMMSILACDDRFVSSAIYHRFKAIADATGEGPLFGQRFLEKIVQVHFRMPGLSGTDLCALGLHVNRPPDTASGDDAPISGDAAPAPVAPDEALSPVKDVTGASETLDEISLVEICGEVLTVLISYYPISIRRAKFLSNLVKLYSMVFQPTNDVSAYRLSAFLMITHLDPAWMETRYPIYAENPDLADEMGSRLMGYLGNDGDAIMRLYLLCGIEKGRSTSAKAEIQDSAG